MMFGRRLRRKTVGAGDALEVLEHIDLHEDGA